MKNKKSYIDTYETIYPVDIVVANKACSIEELRELYTYSDGVILDDDVCNKFCTTCTVRRIEDGRYAILIKFNEEKLPKWANPKEDLVDSCAHEALHAALDIYEYVGQKVDNRNNEDLAYFIGWIAARIYRTVTRK